MRLSAYERMITVEHLPPLHFRPMSLFPLPQHRRPEQHLFVIAHILNDLVGRLAIGHEHSYERVA